MRKRKNNSVVHGEGAESNRLNAVNPQLFLELEALSPKESNPALLPEPEPAPAKESDPLPPKDSDHELLPETEPAPTKDSYTASVPELEPAPTKDLRPLLPKDLDPALPPEPQPASPKEPEQQKRKRRKKRKINSVVNCEGAELNKPIAENPQIFPALNPLPTEESEPVLLLEPEPAHTKESDPLPPKDSNPASLLEPEPPLPKELEGQKRRKSKRKNKSVVNGEGTETNKPNAENPQLFPELDPLTPKDSDLSLLPEPEPAPQNEPDGQKKKRRKKKNKSVVNGEGIESNRPNAENPQLFPEFDPLPSKDSDCALHPETEPAALKVLDQPKKKSKKKKKKSAVNGEGPPKDSDLSLLAKPEPAPPKGSAQPKKKTKEKKIEEEEFFRRKFLNDCIYHMTRSVSRQLGYISKVIPPPRYLRKDVEICYFCLELGHSLGKCPESPGAKFANCLVCNERGHLCTNCPQKSHYFDPKVLPANELIKESAVSDVPKGTLAAAVGTEENISNEATTITLGQVIDVVLNHGFTV